jgi:hypothetical protein
MADDAKSKNAENLKKVQEIRKAKGVSLKEAWAIHKGSSAQPQAEKKNKK